MKIGSKIVFNTAPNTIVAIAYLGLPSARIIEFNAVPIIIKGNPITIILPYCIAYSLKLSVHPNKFNNCGKNTKLKIHNTTAIIADNKIPFPTPFAASSFFFSPSFKLK